MLAWSEYFYWKLLESQKAFAQSMNHKTDWKYFKVLKSWYIKQNQPRYYDIALHKVVLEEFDLEIAKSTISEWINRVPQLLEREDELKELVDIYFNSSIEKKSEKEEPKYTKAEWEYLHRLEWEKINIEYRAMMARLQNPKLTDIELMKLTWASQRLINKINNYWITMNDLEKQKTFIELNEQIMLLWNERLLREIEKMPALNMRDLKALSGIVDDVFKQNRLLTGQSTENVAHWIDDVYEAILRKAESVKELPEKKEEKIETAKVVREVEKNPLSE